MRRLMKTCLWKNHWFEEKKSDQMLLCENYKEIRIKNKCSDNKLYVAF